MAKKAAANGAPRKRGRPPKAKQGWLDGMEPETVPGIEEAARYLYDTRAERMRLGKEEDSAADRLLALMEQRGLKVYETSDGKRVEVHALKKVKVRRGKEDDHDADGHDA